MALGLEDAKLQSVQWFEGDEIKQWLESNPVDYYVIIDDDNDMLTEQHPFFVHTDADDGIRWSDYEKAERILTGHSVQQNHTARVKARQASLAREKQVTSEQVAFDPEVKEGSPGAEQPHL